MLPSLWKMDTTYLTLPEKLYRRQDPTPVRNPELFLWNEDLAEELGIPQDLSSVPGEVESQEISKKRKALAKIFSGNQIPEGSEPLAQAYAGHQFGHFTMLGDGRAILMGEILDRKGKRRDVQWKGSGRTPYSRGGDGRATLYSMLREFLISEAMHYLGIPTSRSLAVVSTGENVYREEIHPGGVLTRVAASHLRVGTFECVYHFLSPDELQSLTSYAIQRHYPKSAESENPAMELLKSVMHSQIRTILDWMRVGFIHGVMNTDNTSISGETFDYGPCAFMNFYDPGTVFSSIDRGGRYAFGNQPAILQWNLACFANSLLPMIHDNQEKAVELAKDLLDSYAVEFDLGYWKMMGEKIGLPRADKPEQDLIQDLRTWMQKNKADYTNTFLALEDSPIVSEEAIYREEEFVQWKKHWKKRLAELGIGTEEALERMEKSNPAVIPRNHIVEEALVGASSGDLGLLLDFWDRLKNPYHRSEKRERFHLPPQENMDEAYQTFCGT